MSGWWIESYANAFGLAFVVSWVVWVVASIVLHELAHGWAALSQGDPTPRALGHMTWNPLVHIGGFGLIMLALIGIAWGAMPVDPSRFRSRHGDALVAAAGPAMNMLLAIISTICCIGWIVIADRLNIGEPMFTNFANFFWIGAFLNVVLAIFNLFPAPPLDGSRIVASFVPAYARLFQGPNGQWIGLGLFVMVFWFVGGRMYTPVMVVLAHTMNAALTALGHKSYFAVP